ncbi:hypothetical protein GUJ93_ZPchr0006g42057 [Zizania palustris]|uniref:Uncharacterized protein n=1 Tax=Zizania palustris TaxID=103762 RepID=A0A8J5SUI0_ZIZPA|nr:hypothetical protein GUJ93_ZPchr0006g42057 [Zizania palustris]
MGHGGFASSDLLCPTVARRRWLAPPSLRRDHARRLRMPTRNYFAPHPPVRGCSAIDRQPEQQEETPKLHVLVKIG